MKLRFECQALLSLCILPALLASQSTPDQGRNQPPAIATIQVLVRNRDGVAVGGLTAADFVVTEHGRVDRIDTVQSFASAPQAREAKVPHAAVSALATTNEGSLTPPPSLATQADPNRPAPLGTYILLILAPMSFEGRDYALRSILRFLNKPQPENWHIALFDDQGGYLPFGTGKSQLLQAVQHLDTHVSTPQLVNGGWMTKANRAIEQLAIQPGRRAIVFASDFRPVVTSLQARNPNLLRIGPSLLIGSAVRAQAAMYTVQASGAGTVVPFGSAAGTQYTGSAQEVAQQLMLQTVGLGAEQRNYIYAAAETGGLTAADPQQAFSEISNDGPGHYRIRFEAAPDEADGAWHPVSIAVRLPGLHIDCPRYYAAPAPAAGGQMPAAMQAALRHGAVIAGFEVSARAWLFPQTSGDHIVALAADLNFLNNTQPANGSSLQIFAQLVDESTGALAGSWLIDRNWPADASRSAPVHFQREVLLYPGSYTLKVIAMDKASGSIGAGEYSFEAYPLDVPAVRFSTIVIAADCLQQAEQERSRRNLFDPMQLKGCELAPPAGPVLKSDQDPAVLVRIYGASDRSRNEMLRQWKAFAVVRVNAGEARYAPMQIAPAEVRGLMAYGKLPLSRMHLAPGPHPVTVLFEYKDQLSRKRQMFLESEPVTILP